jgi:hypothetical protein
MLVGSNDRNVVFVYRDNREKYYVKTYSKDDTGNIYEYKKWLTFRKNSEPKEPCWIEILSGWLNPYRVKRNGYVCFGDNIFVADYKILDSFKRPPDRNGKLVEDYNDIEKVYSPF